VILVSLEDGGRGGRDGDERLRAPRQTAKYDHSKADFDRHAVHMIGAFVPVGIY
jgi:hypothetical protein